MLDAEKREGLMARSRVLPAIVRSLVIISPAALRQYRRWIQAPLPAGHRTDLFWPRHTHLIEMGKQDSRHWFIYIFNSTRCLFSNANESLYRSSRV